MNHDEFAFFNQQLAAMLRDGIPLEGALERLCDEMRDGAMKQELESLRADLSRGVPLAEAVRSRRLPELYQYLLEVGAKSQNLPAVLTMVADYYQRKHNLWTRLKGLMVYPALVLCASFVLSCFLSILLNRFVWPNLVNLVSFGTAIPRGLAVMMWLSPVILGFVAALALVSLTTPWMRRVLRWRMPAFRESSLSEVASAMALLLRAGVPLDHALATVERLEENSFAEKELAEWRKKLAAGHGRFSELAAPGRAFPPLFVWLVSQSGDDIAGGFQKAAEIYQSRASYRREMLLYSALPCSVIAIGFLIIAQTQPVFAALIRFMNMIGDTGG